jgi:hypothetical protein
MRDGSSLSGCRTLPPQGRNCRLGSKFKTRWGSGGGSGAGLTTARCSPRLRRVTSCFTPPPALPFADVLVDGHRETWPIRSKRFRGWLRRRYYEATGSALGGPAIASELDLLEARAQFDAPERLLAFDNLSGLPAWLSDALCRLASGGSFAVRQLYTNDDEVLFQAARPILLNGIEDVISAPTGQNIPPLSPAGCVGRKHSFACWALK